MRLVFALTVSVLTTLCSCYPFSCPSPSQWRFRSSKCKNDLKYMCLLDENTLKYDERCWKKDEIAPEGRKYVIRGNIETTNCIETRFQPLIFSTSGSSDCELEKSQCNERGQMIYNNGSNTQDRTCSCDRNSNFTFVSTNDEFCVPSQEDCSCYEPNGTIHSDFLKDRKRNENVLLSEMDLKNYKIDLRERTIARILILAVTVLLTLSTVSFVCWCIKYTGLDQNEQSNIALSIDYQRTGNQEYNDVPKVEIVHVENRDSTVTIQCCITSDLPLKSVRWIRETNDTTTDLTPVNYDGGSTKTPSLTINNVKPADIGKYHCVSENGAGEGRSNSVSIDRPEVIVERTKYDFEFGKTLTLNCIVCSVLPITKIVWEQTHPNNDVENISTPFTVNRYNGATAQCPSLTIDQVNESDIGTYVCFVSNVVGTTESPVITVSLPIDEEGTVALDDTQKEMNGVEQNEQLSITLSNDDKRTTNLKYKENFPCLTLNSGNILSEKQEICSNTENHDEDMHSAQVVLESLEAKKARERAKRFLDEEIRVVLVGKTGAGKSSTANSILGKKIFKASNNPAPVTEKCMQATGTRFKKSILLIDTPGIFACTGKEKETEIEIKRCIHLAAPGPHTVLFVIPFGRIKKEDFEAIQTFLLYFGTDLKKFVITVFTHADEIEDGQTLESWLAEVPEFKKLLDECGGRYCFINNKGTEKDKETQVKCIMTMIAELKNKNGLLYYVDDSFLNAEKIVQERERKLQESIDREVEHRVQKCLNESTSLNMVIDWCADRISTKRTETRQQLQEAAAEEFKDFNVSINIQ